MIKICKPNKNYYSCQVCGCHKSESEQNEVYAIELMNRNGQKWTEMDRNGQKWTEMDRNGQGIGLHLCKDCCKELGSLLKLTKNKDFKMVSIDDID